MSEARPAIDLRKWDERIWTMEGDVVRMLTIPFPTRMTVVRLESGDLWVHSPVAPTQDRCRAIDALGPVRHIVAPNKIHSLGVSPWKERYPSAKVWVSPELHERHPTIVVDAVLGDEAPSEWRGEIDQLVFGGSFFLDEVLFLHRASRTLIVTDLIQRHDPTRESWWWRTLKGLAGVMGEDGGTARDLRLSFRDRATARRCAERVLAWDFDRLILSHGMCVNRDARAGVERAFAWLQPTRTE